MGRSKAWGEVWYRRLEAPWSPALELFGFVGAWAPPEADIKLGWGAWDGGRLCGALLLERAGSSAMLHGPVVVAPSEAPPEEAIEVAAQLLADGIGQVEAERIETLFARPQGLDRIWVRCGFIPVPEAELPEALRGRPGIGLFGWRGGTALWSAAGRGTSRGRTAAER